MCHWVLGMPLLCVAIQQSGQLVRRVGSIKHVTSKNGGESFGASDDAESAMASKVASHSNCQSVTARSAGLLRRKASTQRRKEAALLRRSRAGSTALRYSLLGLAGGLMVLALSTPDLQVSDWFSSNVIPPLHHLHLVAAGRESDATVRVKLPHGLPLAVWATCRCCCC